jgi:ParB family transcriptional regulator, chromosome partitioning protein
MAETTIRIESVKVVDRYRTDLGDVQALAASIRDTGLLQAIVVTPDMRLVAGQRRLEAARLLGWTVIDARIVDNLDDAMALLVAERAENVERKPMLPSELAALAARLHDIESGDALRRKSDAGRSAAPGRRARKDVTARPQVTERPGGRSRERVGEALGIGSRNAELLALTHKDSQSVNPVIRESAREALKDMDATGHVRSPAERHRQRVYQEDGRLSTTVARRQGGTNKAKDQRRAIEGLIERLNGLTLAIEHIGDLSLEISADETARWADGLIKARTPITTLVNKLRKHTT